MTEKWADKVNGFFGLETYSSDEECDLEQYGLPETSNSTIPEVAVCVPAVDQNTPVLTWRAIIISSILLIFSSFTAQFYFFRINQFGLDSISHIVLAYFLGIVMEKIKMKGLNSGPFSVKEHAIIVITASVGVSYPYSNIVLVIQRLYLNQNISKEVSQDAVIDGGVKIGFIYSYLYMVSAELLGIGLGGLFEKYLVYPAEMWWPSNLVHANLIFTFHGSITRKITKLRMKMFILVVSIGFLYTLFPQLITPLLNSVSVLCLAGGGFNSNIFPEFARSTLAQMGSKFGGGIGAVSFDWTAIATASPLQTPLWSQLNYLASNYFFSWFLTPLLYFLNVFEAKQFPMYSAGSFNSDGTNYNVTDILDPLTYSVRNDTNPLPMRLSINRVIVYGCAFAALTAVLTQFMIYYSRKTYEIFNMSTKELSEKDIHSKLMQKYPQVPLFWYVALLSITMGLSMFVTNANYNAFQIDLWAIPMAVSISFLFAVPTGIIAAISNQFIGLNIFAQLIMGFLKPGSPLANATFKVFTTNSLIRAISYISNMKMAFYMKIPPRYILFAHIYGILVSSLVSYSTIDYLMTNVPEIWNSAHGIQQNGEWQSIKPKIIFTAAQIWGALSPARFFGQDSPYHVLYWSFLIGALLPIMLYLLQKQYPHAGFHYINFPILFQSASSVASGNANSIFSVTLVTVLTQYFLRKFHRRWYDRYNYIASAGLDFSVALVAILIAGVQQVIPSQPFIPSHPLNPFRNVFGQDYCGNIPV